MAAITVGGLGPAGPEFVTQQVRALISGPHPVWLRTKHHPAASLAGDAPTFDDVYDRAEKISDVYAAIVERLVQLADQHDRVVYLVPGSPLVAEHTVELLREDARVEVEVLPALSFLELIWSRLGIDPLTAQPRIVDGQSFTQDAAGQTGPLIVAQCDSRAVLTDIKLAFEDVVPSSVTVMQRLGTEDESIETMAWADLDRAVDADHLTTLWIPEVAVPVAHDLERLNVVARQLRTACPWDREQTHSSLKRYAIEETYELVDAIDELNVDDEITDDHLIEELGDVLYQVFAHAAVAEQDGRFNMSDVARNVTDKLIERHPHVYGDAVAETSEDVRVSWESNKMKAKGRESVLDGIPSSLPALMLATKVLKRVQDSEVALPVDAAPDSDLGSALFQMVDNARQKGLDAEDALRRAVVEYSAMFRAAEAANK